MLSSTVIVIVSLLGACQLSPVYAVALPAVASLPAIKTPDVKVHVSPEGYHYAIDEANALKEKLPSGNIVSFARPGSSANPALVVRGLLKKRLLEDACGWASFENRSSGGSPLIQHCRDLANWAYRKGDHWENYGGNMNGQYWNVLAVSGTCAFGIHHQNVYVTNIGSADIGDLLTSSIDRFAWFDKVGAEGHMPCSSAGSILFGKTNVHWAVFHS